MSFKLLNVLKESREVIQAVGDVMVNKVELNGEKIKGTSEINLSEVNNKLLENIKNSGDGVMLKLNNIKNLTPEQLREQMVQNLERMNESLECSQENSEGFRKGLTDEEKIKIKNATGWSDKIIEAIGSWEEYVIYKNADLVEAEIGGKPCLIRKDIDWNQKDAMGRTNKERANQGLSPINKDCKSIELHHIGQHADSPLAELTQEEHRGKGNDAILHDKTKESEIDRQAFAREKNNHWLDRAQESGETL